MWSWRPDAGAKLAMIGDFALAAETPASRGRRGQESPVPEESADISVNTIARGMPVISAEPVVTAACYF